MCAGQPDGQARLVGGSADAGGTWEYGRLEVLIEGVWSIILEGDLGRRGAQVACRSLGYATGAQLLVGSISPFPAVESGPNLISSIICEGSEDSLSDCSITLDNEDHRNLFVGESVPEAVAIICTTPSGASTECLSEESPKGHPKASNSGISTAKVLRGHTRSG